MHSSASLLAFSLVSLTPLVTALIVPSEPEIFHSSLDWDILDYVQNAEVINLPVMEFPEEVKAQLSAPSWLENWEDAEFGYMGEYGEMYGTNLTDTKEQAAAYLASFTGGMWLTNEAIESLPSSERDKLMDTFMSYYEKGDERILFDLHRALGREVETYDSDDDTEIYGGLVQ